MAGPKLAAQVYPSQIQNFRFDHLAFFVGHSDQFAPKISLFCSGPILKSQRVWFREVGRYAQVGNSRDGEGHKTSQSIFPLTGSGYNVQMLNIAGSKCARCNGFAGAT